jgi:putative phage-type endonuclease
MEVAIDRSQGPVSFEVLCDSTVDEERWLQMRMLGIGASESASIQGISPWVSRYALWALKTKRITPQDLSDNEAVFWGKRLEWPIIAGYAERTKRAVVPFALLIRSIRWPWLLATPDALTTDDEEARKNAHPLNRCIGAMRRLLRQKRHVPFELIAEFEALAVGWFPLQVKNIGLGSAEHWHEGAPDYYRVQCQQEALLLGKARCSAGALVAGQALIWEDVLRDELSDRRIVNLGRTFWQDYVQADVSPMVDGSSSTTVALKGVWKKVDPEKLLQLGGDMLQLAEERDALKEQLKLAEARVQEIDNKIRDVMKDAPEARFPDGSGFTLNQYDQPAKTVSYKACSYRMLLRKKKPSDKKTRAPKKKKKAAEAESEEL